VELLPRLRAALAGRYTIERELGRGGMAIVYLGRDLRHDRFVVLKVLHSELAATLGPERFQREIKLAARLQHPHILTVLDSGDSAEQLWYTIGGLWGDVTLGWGWFGLPEAKGKILRDKSGSWSN
jgi:eukaryotic-like serine/threonine-protein kinase